MDAEINDDKHVTSGGQIDMDKNENMKDYENASTEESSTRQDVANGMLLVDNLTQKPSCDSDDVCRKLEDFDLDDSRDKGRHPNNDQEISGIVPEGNRSIMTQVEAPNPVGAGDTSVTDDEIEVICRYTSPRFDDAYPKINSEREQDETLGLDDDGVSAEDHFQNDFGFPIQDEAIISSQPLPQQMMFVSPNPQAQVNVNQGECFQIGNHSFYNPTLLPPPQLPHPLHTENFHQHMMSTENQEHQSPDEAWSSDPCMPINYQQQTSAMFYQPYSTTENQHTPQYNYPMPLPYVNPNVRTSVYCSDELDQSVPCTPGTAMPGMIPNEMNMYPTDQNVPADSTDHTMSNFSPKGVNPGPHINWAEDSEYIEEIPRAFVYPSIYVSASGMVTVLLKHDVSVEMTVDRTIRLVNHQRRMAVATNSRGTASVLHTPSAKVSQTNTTTDADVNGVNIKMTTEAIWFGSGSSNYKFDYNYISPASPNFTDLSSDKSVNLLFASDSYGSTLVPQCLHCADTAEYEFLPKGGVIVRINGLKITQTGRGDVTVVSGPKFLKISPAVGYIRLNTHFTEMAVDKDGVLRMRRGNHTINSSNGGAVLSNGKLEAGLDEQGRLKVYTLPKRQPLDVASEQRRSRPGNPRRKATALGGAS